MTKHFLLSKTLWFNVLSFCWQFVGPKIGLPVLDPDTFTAIITIMNIVLRVVSHGKLTIGTGE